MKHRFMTKSEQQEDSHRLEQSVYAVSLGKSSYEKIHATTPKHAIQLTGGYIAYRMGSHETLEHAVKRLGWA